jgi:CTP-dependent riboflavin kinase
VEDLRQVETESPTDLSALRSWAFITSHARILLALARDPHATVAELAQAVEMTERSAYRMLADLQKEGYVQRRKSGRQNSYEINSNLPLLDPIVEDGLVRDLLRLVDDDEVEAHLSRRRRSA